MDNGISAEFDRVAEQPQEGITRFRDMSANSLKIHREKFTTALRDGDLKTVRVYVEAYSDALTFVLAPAGHKETALDIAAKSGQTPVIAYLAGKGAPLNSRGPGFYDDTAMESAALYHQENAVMALLDLGAEASVKLLMYSAVHALPRVVERLLDMGFSPNAEEADGTSVLMKAALASNAFGAAQDQTVDLLLKRGADPLHENKNFDNAVSMALISVNAHLASKLDRARSAAKMQARDAALNQRRLSAPSPAPQPG